MNSAIETVGLTHYYSKGTPQQVAAISDVNLRIKKGELVGIIGHTGSGKSTLVGAIGGLIEPDEGQVLIDGADGWQNRKKIREHRFRVGLVMQYPEYQLFEETIRKDIAFGPKNMKLSDAEIKERVFRAADFVGVKREHLDQSPFDLSGGEKRRVAIAGVMAMRPDVIVFDEPTAGLDPKGRDNVIKIIKDYRNAYNATVIIISHSMEDMAEIADKLLVMNKGELFMFDTVENVFSKEEELLSIGLNVPIVTRVFAHLRELGVNVRKDIFTVGSAVKELKRLTEGERDA